MKKLAIISNLFISTLALLACSNNKNTELDKYAYVQTNFDMNVLNSASKLETTVLGTSMSKPLYEGECKLDSTINSNLKNLLIKSEIYFDNDPIKGFNQCTIIFKYHFANNSTISIYRGYEPKTEVQGMSHSYLLNNKLLYKDFYNCWMSINSDNTVKAQYILDLGSLKNLKELNNVFDDLYTYLNIEFK